MRVLLVAATAMEVKLLTEECKLITATSDNLKTFKYKNVEFDTLITGIGSTFTTFHLTNTLNHNKYSLVINLGISGSLSPQLQIGEVVNVVNEEFADLGIEKEFEFLSLFDSGFMHPDEFPFENRTLKINGIHYAGYLPKVRGITTNASHGREATIQEIKLRFSAQVESMEGAAVFYVCSWLGVPCMQIRAISNYVAPRDVAKWDIPLALENLKNCMLKVLDEIEVRV